MEDQRLTCVICHQDFLFVVGEQLYFASKGYHPPKRCKACRPPRESSRPSDVSCEATCSSCGADTIVPFIPIEGKSVYCVSCYRTRMGGV